MIWYGKVTGAVLGLLLTRRPFGLLIGLILGHAIDAGWLRGRRASDPWQVLGIERGASPAEAEQAYRRLIAQYHPDRVAGAGPELRDLAESRTRALNAAIEAIRKRQRQRGS